MLRKISQKWCMNSAAKLRLGVFCIFLWWAPFWALAAPIANKLDLKVSSLTLLIMTIQTIIGVLGFYLVGKPVARLIKGLPFRRVPGTIWYMLVYGKEKNKT
jgi:hypothetical protein